MKKLENKLNEEDLLEDINKIIEYANSLTTLDIENTDLDKMKNEVENFSKNLKKKYKEYIPKEDLDSKK